MKKTPLSAWLLGLQLQHGSAGVRKPASLLHCTATQGGRWFYGEDKRIGGSEMQRLPRPEGKAGNVWLAWHGMAAGEYGGGCGCLPPPRQAAGAGAYLEAAEWRA